MKDDCCLKNGEIFRSLFDNNVWAPERYPTGWGISKALAQKDGTKPKFNI